MSAAPTTWEAPGPAAHVDRLADNIPRGRTGHPLCSLLRRALQYRRRLL